MTVPYINPTAGDTVIDGGVGGYVRWRGRMVRSSVYNDLVATLTATGWTNATLDYPFTVKEYFPEFAVYVQDSVHVNTLVLDDGEPTPLEEWEMGGLLTQVYRFNLAFYGQDEETGLAVFADLSDRFQGLTNAPFVPLYNYNVAGPTFPLIRMMAVESFQFVHAPADAVPYDHHLFFAELLVRDFVDGDRTVMSA